MELKVWVDDIQRIVCGVSKHTTAEDVCRALAIATGQTGRFVLIERRGAVCERRLGRDDKPLKILEQWGEFANNIHFILRRTDLRHHRPPQTSITADTGRRHSAAATAFMPLLPQQLKRDVVMPEETLSQSAFDNRTSASQTVVKALVSDDDCGRLQHQAASSSKLISATTAGLNPNPLPAAYLPNNKKLLTNIQESGHTTGGSAFVSLNTPSTASYSSPSTSSSSSSNRHQIISPSDQHIAVKATLGVTNHQSADEQRQSKSNHNLSLPGQRKSTENTYVEDVDFMPTDSYKVGRESMLLVTSNRAFAENLSPAAGSNSNTSQSSTITPTSKQPGYDVDSDDDAAVQNSEADVLERIVHGEELEMKRQFLIAQLSAMHSEHDALDERTGKCITEIENWHKQIAKQEQMLTQLQQQVVKLEQRTAAYDSSINNSNNLAMSLSPNAAAPVTAGSTAEQRAALDATIEALKERYRRLHAVASDCEHATDEHRHACDVLEHDISSRLFDAEKLSAEFEQALAGELTERRIVLQRMETELRLTNLQVFLNGNSTTAGESVDAVVSSAGSITVDADNKSANISHQLAAGTDDDAVEQPCEPPAPPVTFVGDHVQLVDGAVPTPSAVHSVKKRHLLQQQHLYTTTGSSAIHSGVNNTFQYNNKQHQHHHQVPRVVMLKRNAARNPEGLWV